MLIASECTVDWCDRPQRAKGYCKVHYNRSRSGGDMNAPIRGASNYRPRGCNVEGCPRVHDAHGLCSGHLNRLRNGRDLNKPFNGEVTECSVSGCSESLKAKGLCATHYQRNRLGQDLNAPVRPRYTGEMSGCLVPDCDRPYAAMGLCRRHTNQRINYGLTVERIIELSNKPCYICGGNDNPHIDHDHSCCPGGNAPKCGQCVRGVLCRGCNLALGQFEDRIELLERAVLYLEGSEKQLRINKSLRKSR